MDIFISLIIGFIGGATVLLFVLKNNPKYINFDKMLGTLGKDKLAELKIKAEELLKKVWCKIPIKDLKIPVKQGYTKKSLHKISPDSLIKEYRDPAGRALIHQEEEFKLPIPGKITSLRRFVPKPQGPKQQKETKQEPSDKLSNYL